VDDSPIDKTPIALHLQGSDIKLRKTSEFIEIIFPPPGVGLGLIALFSTAVAATATLWGNFDYNKTTNSEINLLILMMISGNLLAVVGVMFVFALFRKLCLRIDRQQISFFSHLFGLKWNYSKPAPRQDIGQLEIEQIEYTVPVRVEKLYRASLVIVLPENQKYRLGVKQGLSESEIEWLATELSQWLGLKIQRTLTDGKKNISR
jgi:hypothetical protein